MPAAGSASAMTRRTGLWLKPVVFSGVYVFIFVYYWALLSDGRFLDAPPIHLGLMYNSMIEYLSEGRFDVDPRIIRFEGFTRDNHTYAYFGVMPAFLRLPILLFPSLRGVDFTLIFCAIGATLAAVLQLTAVLRAGRAIAGALYVRRIMLFAMAIVIFGGSQVQFLRPTVYQEPEYWASALASLVVLLAFTWCIDPASRRPSRLMWMAVVAGVCLLTRVSNSIGLYAACGAIMLSELVTAVRRGDGSRFGRMILPPSLILVLFAAICGFINYQRWGSPLTFQDYRYYNLLRYDNPVYEVLYHYGYFDVRRIPFGLSYFFLPVWTIIRPDGHFLFRELQDRMYFFIEFPPATFFASDLFVCFLAVLGGVWLSRRRWDRIDVFAARLVAVGLAIPGVLMLMAIAYTFRYRMEFYPFFEFLALFGLFRLADKIARHPRAITAVCAAMIAVSIISSHAMLLTYKIMPGGDTIDIEKIGWIAAWRGYFHDTYPAFERRLMYRFESD
jgi:hypothetical protein